jgi:hypothetical protein
VLEEGFDRGVGGKKSQLIIIIGVCSGSSGLVLELPQVALGSRRISYMFH